jgi:ComF family protein
MGCQPKHINKVYSWLSINQSCTLCDQAAEGPVPLCAACYAELPWLGQHCQCCALPLQQAGKGKICGRCLRRPPSFNQVEAAWRYEFPVDALITRFKHQANWPLGRLLGELLARHLRQAFINGLNQPQALLPVPLSAKRQRQRGFNQARLLAQVLTNELGIATHPEWLQRTRDMPAQQTLAAAARRRNLRGAFSLAASDKVKGLHLALIDDVLTTGSTAQELSRLLKRAGARQVDIYCLARTLPPAED